MLGRLLGDISASVAWGGMSTPLSIFASFHIMDRLRRIRDIVERIRAGTYRPRCQTSARRTPTGSGQRAPRRAALVPQNFGWLMKLLPMQYWNANAYSNDLAALLAEPEMQALIQAAPTALGRPIRSLCWMFRVKPPPLLAPAKRSSPAPHATRPTSIAADVPPEANAPPRASPPQASIPSRMAPAASPACNAATTPIPPPVRADSPPRST